MPATAITPNPYPFQLIRTGSFTLDVANITAGQIATDTAAVPEARVGDIVLVQHRATQAMLVVCLGAYVSADGSITMVFANPTAGALNQASATYDYVLIRGNTGVAG